MVKRQEGFSLIELMITMVVFLLAIAAASNVFTGLLTQFKQQSKIAETNIEGAVGLEILRRDLESAGYGLAWNVEIDGDGDGNDWEQLVGYCEAAATAAPDPSLFNNGRTFSGLCPAVADAGSTAPMAIRSGNNTGVDFTAVPVVGESSDYLVIKSTTVAINDTAKKWTYLRAGPVLNTWTPACENLNKYPNAGDTDCSTGASTDNTVMVIVISPGGSTAANTRSLITNAGVLFTQYSGTANFDPPTGSTDTYMVYGVDKDTNLRMPFNRADYFIRRVDAGGNNITPSGCAPNTGVLEKVVVNQGDGRLTNFLPLLDCVADMQIVYGLDNNEDGEFRDGVGGDAYSDDILGLTAAQIRTRVKEIRVYILAHEGQMDAAYTYPNATITVGPDAALGRLFNLGTNLNYRWKVYTLVVRPNNLR